MSPRVPGGRQEQPQATALTRLMNQMSEFAGSIIVDRFSEDPDFVQSFIQAVPDPEEQKKYLYHTAKYDVGIKDYDPAYVLFFRRTLPSPIPKPEERWSNDFLQTRNGLRREIPEGPHRYHSIILCDSLAHLLTTGKQEGNTRPWTDGEIVVHYQQYDQSSSICQFKPQREKEALAHYLQTQDALTLEETLKKVQEYKIALRQTRVREDQ